MPWRLVGFTILFTVFLVFIASNLKPENRCNITFIAWTIPNVPVFVTVFSSFVLGMFCAIPVIISVHLKKKKDRGGLSVKPHKKRGREEESGSQGDDNSIDKGYEGT